MLIYAAINLSTVLGIKMVVANDGEHNNFSLVGISDLQLYFCYNQTKVIAQKLINFPKFILE